MTVETVTLTEYTLEPVQIEPDRAEALLGSESLRMTLGQMVAGRVERGSTAMNKTQDSYRCRGVWNCVELISRTVPAELFGEDEENGKTD